MCEQQGATSKQVVGFCDSSSSSQALPSLPLHLKHELTTGSCEMKCKHSAHLPSRPRRRQSSLPLCLIPQAIAALVRCRHSRGAEAINCGSARGREEQTMDRHASLGRRRQEGRGRAGLCCAPSCAAALPASCNAAPLLPPPPSRAATAWQADPPACTGHCLTLRIFQHMQHPPTHPPTHPRGGRLQAQTRPRSRRRHWPGSTHMKHSSPAVNGSVVNGSVGSSILWRFAWHVMPCHVTPCSCHAVALAMVSCRATTCQLMLCHVMPSTTHPHACSAMP